MILKSPHSPLTDVTQFFHWIETVSTAPLTSKPSIYECVTKTVRQGVYQQTRQAVKSFLWQGRKRIHLRR